MKEITFKGRHGFGKISVRAKEWLGQPATSYMSGGAYGGGP